MPEKLPAAKGPPDALKGALSSYLIEVKYEALETNFK